MQRLQVQLILALLRHRLQVGSERSLGDRFSIIVVILLTFDERPDIDRWDDPRLKSQAA